ncbi:MAG: Fe-Mn family superoxide dismutase [Polyangiales bacterium]
MEFVVAPLRYSKDALAPAMSEETLDYHYGKHHAAYMNNLKGLLEGKPEASKSLEEIVKSSSGGVFNNAAQVWNHTFFWNSMKPQGGGEPTGEVADLLVRDFGSVDAFKTEFVTKGLGQFGSGWVWLVLDGGKAKIVTTGNAETPLTTSAKPLLTADVWEHAYYIDHRNNRKGFLEVFLSKLVNWDFIAENLRG